MTLFRNGVQAGQRTDLPATATADINGKILAQDNAYFLKGLVDEVSLYPQALSPTTIQQHYQTGRP